MQKWMAILFISLVMMISACSPGPSSKTPAPTAVPDGATLLQERCSRCHPLARVERSHHNADEWKTIVDSMIGRGAMLTPEEETVVIEYLAANFGK